MGDDGKERFDKAIHQLDKVFEGKQQIPIEEEKSTPKTNIKVAVDGNLDPIKKPLESKEQQVKEEKIDFAKTLGSLEQDKRELPVSEKTTKNEFVDTSTSQVEDNEILLDENNSKNDQHDSTNKPELTSFLEPIDKSKGDSQVELDSKENLSESASSYEREKQKILQTLMEHSNSLTSKKVVVVKRENFLKEKLNSSSDLKVNFYAELDKIDIKLLKVSKFFEGGIIELDKELSDTLNIYINDTKIGEATLSVRNTELGLRVKKLFAKE